MNTVGVLWIGVTIVFTPALAQVQGGLGNGGQGGDAVWLGECSIHHSCVAKHQCLGGIINTSGAGLLNPRLGGGELPVRHFS